MRMLRQARHIVDPGEGDVGGGELLRQRLDVQRGEHGGDLAVGLGAAFHAFDIGGEFGSAASAASPSTFSASTRHSRSFWIEIRMSAPSRVLNTP